MRCFYQRFDFRNVIQITPFGTIFLELAQDERYKGSMQPAQFRASLHFDQPPEGLSASLQALWWDAKGDWSRAHSLVDELETAEGMAVHAYLHRKEG
jgi:hypothetical protein